MHVAHFPFYTSYAQVTNTTVRQITANERYVKRLVFVIRVYIRARSAISLSMEYRHEAAVVSREHRMQ